MSDEVPETDPESAPSQTRTAGHRLRVAAVIVLGALLLGLVATNIVLWIRLDDTRTKVSHVDSRLNDASKSIDDASNRLDDVESNIGNYSGTGIADDLDQQSSDLDQVKSDLEALTSCVNDHAAGSC